MRNGIEVDGLVEQREALERLMMNNPETEKKVQGLVRQVLKEARAKLQGAAKEMMTNDPRGAYKAVKMAVYRRILGGSVSILNRRKAGAPGRYSKPRKLRTGQVGGNRRVASARTKQVESYTGADRGFILRFLNAGTGERFVAINEDSRRGRINYGARGGRVPRSVNTGYRGRLSARGWFRSSGVPEMNKAAEKLGGLIDEMVKNALK